MRGRKRKQSVQVEEEPKVETTNVQESQSSKNIEKIVPSFGKKKKVSNVKRRSANTGIVKPSTHTTSVDVHREEAHPADELENENASTETILAPIDKVEGNPEASSDTNDPSDLGIQISPNKSKEQISELATLNTNKGASEPMSSPSQILVPDVRYTRSLQFDPSGDAKPYQNFTKDAPNITEIFDEIGKPISIEDSTESFHKCVAQNATSSSAEFSKNADEIVTNTAPTNDDSTDINVVEANTTPTKHDGVNENVVVTNTTSNEDEGAKENAVVIKTAPSKDDADQFDASPTLRDLSYEEESQESVVEIHKLLDYRFENFPKLSETKTLVFGSTKDSKDEGQIFCDDTTSQIETSLAGVSPCSCLSDARCFSNDSTAATTTDSAVELQNPIYLQKVAQSSIDKSPYPTATTLSNTQDVSIPPTQGFEIREIDLPITATRNFEISYSPLMSITPDSSNPGSPVRFPDKDDLVGSTFVSNSLQETRGAHPGSPGRSLDKDAPVGSILASDSLQETRGAHQGSSGRFLDKDAPLGSIPASDSVLDAKPAIESQINTTLQDQESVTTNSQAKIDSSKENPRIDRGDDIRKTFEEPSKDSSADTEEQRRDENQERSLSKINQKSPKTTKQVSFPLRQSTSKNDMLKLVDLIQNKEYSSVDNSFEEEDMNMGDDFGVSDSQMCAIDYEEPMVMADSCQQKSLPHKASPPHRVAPPLRAATSQVSRPDEEGHNIIQDVIRDISGLNKMLLKTKREMEAFRRSRGFTPLQNRNWQQ